MAADDTTNTLIEVRKEYIELVKKELLGPGSEISVPDEAHELITNSPDVRYSIGILFPRNNQINANNDDSAKSKEESTENPFDGEDELEDADLREETGNTIKRSYQPDDRYRIKEDFDLDDISEANLDDEIGLAAQNMPSSMGITFFAFGDSSSIKCKVSFAT